MCLFLCSVSYLFVIIENEAIQFTEGHRGRQNVFRWPKNLFLIAIDCHRLASIIIVSHIFLGGQKQNVFIQKKYGEMKLHNSC